MVEVKLTRAAWELLDNLDGRVALPFREPSAAARELSGEGLAVWLSGASWTLAITDAGRAALTKGADHD